MQTILTGDRPTGALHLGHYIGSLANRVILQNNYKQYVMIADLQALTDNANNVNKIRDNIIEVALDYLAVGIDPDKTTLFIQSLIPELTELTFYYMNLVTLARLNRNPTVKNEIVLRGFSQNIPVGFFCYPISQAADITAFNAELVPAGADQKPLIEQTNEIVRVFNHTYKTNVLSEVQLLESHVSRLVGLDGKNKMSKSLNNAIFIKDPPRIIREKVLKMYTDAKHLRITDPGQVEGNVVFTFLDAFDPDKNTIAELKAHYQRGGLADSILKNRLIDLLIELLAPIQQRRSFYEKDKGEIINILINSSNKARQIAAHTLNKVKTAMGISAELLFYKA